MPNSDFWKRNQKKGVQKEIQLNAANLGVNPRAMQIFYNSCFDDDDALLPWIDNPDATPEDLDFARSAGLMPEPVELEHDLLVSRVIELRDSTDAASVSGAFVESLESGRKDTRSALGSYAHALHLKPHEFQADSENLCAVCGARKTCRIDLTASSFRRLRWAGNVEHGNLEYIYCDLLEFTRLKAPVPSEKATSILRQVLDSLRRLPESATLSELNKALTGAFKSNKKERQVVLEILGYAGVLSPSGCDSYLDDWVPPSSHREPTHFYQKEWQYPTALWTGKDGINEDAVRFWFGSI
ncbi:MAG: hypothetical protein KC777_23685 [Cyanobacteria bacterium HKST-UBA02]|nr:hypothetical protein [Cyanobacteria bacterium HKST-UBA02]